jgi:glucokinase
MDILKGEIMGEFCVGIDIGGTSIRFCVYDADKKYVTEPILKKRFMRLGDAKEEIEKNICEAMDNIISDHKAYGMTLRSIGISLAALFERSSGNITLWPNNQVWNGFPFRSYLEDRYKVRILLEDDSNCAALGEQWKGEGVNKSSFVYITISTGISCGIIINKKLYYGVNGWAGEIGHISLKDDGPECVCGKVGCFQALASGPAIVSLYRENTGSDKSITSVEDIARYALNDDTIALKAFQEAAFYIAKMIGMLVAILDIDTIILGGGVIKTGKFFKDFIMEYIKKIYGANRKIEILFSELHDINGIYGALKLCIDDFRNQL